MSQWAPFRLTKRLRSSGSIILASGWERLALLLVVAIFLTLWVATGNVDADMLFQSPQSPPVQPAAEQPPVAQPPVEQPPAQQPPAAPPPAEQPPAEQPPVEQAPVEQPPAEQSPAEPAPVEQAPTEQPASDIAPSAAEPAAPTAAPEQPIPEPIRREREEAPPDVGAEEGSSNFILDQVELIDTVVVSGAYIWLCCGVGLFLFVPLLLLFVYIRGRSKITQEQNFW